MVVYHYVRNWFRLVALVVDVAQDGISEVFILSAEEGEVLAEVIHNLAEAGPEAFGRPSHHHADQDHHLYRG